MRYPELLDEAMQLAYEMELAHLPSRSAIGVFLEKGREQVVSCLAVLFSGHHFVPFNLANPEARLALLIQESHISEMISTRELAHQYYLPESLLIDVTCSCMHRSVWRLMSC
jgi:acyl-CoA synthetase (AMP-forming)/AMP-acid ligase II